MNQTLDVVLPSVAQFVVKRTTSIGHDHEKTPRAFFNMVDLTLRLCTVCSKRVIEVWIDQVNKLSHFIRANKVDYLLERFLIIKNEPGENLAVIRYDRLVFFCDHELVGPITLHRSRPRLLKQLSIRGKLASARAHDWNQHLFTSPRIANPINSLADAVMSR